MLSRELVPTGVSGLDSVLRGGIPRNNVTVIVGPVGSGKTTLGLHFICHGATKCDEPGLVVLFEVSPELITRDASQFGWDLEGLEQHGRVKILYTTRQAFEDELKQPDSVLLAEARAMGAKRIFIDSYGLAQNGNVAQNGNGSPREAFHLLLEGLHRERLSAILSVEVSSPASSNPFEQFLSDTVIRLGADSERGALARSLEVVKSRGHDFVTGRHTLDIREGIGVVVYRRAQTKSEASISSATATQLAGARVSSGIPGFDEMLGGGYLPLSSTLFAGMSGVGKSVASLQFLAEGLARGERGLFVSLDEPVPQVLRNAASLGIDLSGPMASGTLRIQYDSPQELVVDRHFADIESLLEELRPTRAVIDSISAYRARLGAAGPEFVDLFGALVALMKQHGVTAVYNLENPELAGMTSVAGGASLSSTVDNIVMLNWVELGDEYRHAITVAKTRGSESTRITRECRIIDHQGMRVLDRVIPPGVVAMPFAGYRSLTARSPERSRRDEEDER